MIVSIVAIVVAYATSQCEYLVINREDPTYGSVNVRVLAPSTFVARCICGLRIPVLIHLVLHLQDRASDYGACGVYRHGLSLKSCCNDLRDCGCGCEFGDERRSFLVLQGKAGWGWVGHSNVQLECCL
jgi:hypothetical protein